MTVPLGALEPLYQVAVLGMTALLGAMVGSFLNVLVYRLPLGKTVVWDFSACPHCQARIAPYDNIPILSWFILRGRCRHCSGSISWRYPLVEAGNALLWVAVLLRFGLSFPSLVYLVFLSALVVVTGVDVDHQIIPDGISVGGTIAALLLPLGLRLLHREYLWPMTIRSALIGMAVGGGFLLTVALGYLVLTRREGMGIGDVKLMALVGALLGWPAALLTIFGGSILGVLVITPVMALTGGDRKTPIPFGPFLALGAVFSLFFGADLIYWYRSLAGF